VATIISIRSNFPEVQKALNRLADDVGNRALTRAMNRTVEQGRTQMARQISTDYRIKVRDARDRLFVWRARAKPGQLVFEAALEATRRGQGRSMNLIGFVTSAPRTLKSGKKTQIKFQIKRGGGRKQITGAFIGNRGRTVFIRTGAARLPIKALNTIDVPEMFNARRINDAVRKVMLERFEVNFQREMRAVLGGFA